MLNRIISVILGLAILGLIFFAVMGILSKTKTKTVTEVQPISPPVQTVADPHLAPGAQTVQKPGADGQKKVTYKITTDKKTGKEIKRQQTSEKVLVAAQPKVLAVSTTSTPQTGPEDAAPLFVVAMAGAYIWYLRSQRKLRMAHLRRSV
jgi:uncharacterized protein YabE (DUF348 family)